MVYRLFKCQHEFSFCVSMNWMLLLIINNVNPLSVTATIPVRTTTTSSPKSQTQRSTEVQRTTTRDVDGPSSESSRKSSTVPSNQSFSSNEPKKVTAPTGLPLNPVTSTGSHLSISGEWNCFHLYRMLMAHGLKVAKYSISGYMCRDEMRNI